MVQPEFNLWDEVYPRDDVSLMRYGLSDDPKLPRRWFVSAVIACVTYDVVSYQYRIAQSEYGDYDYTMFGRKCDVRVKEAREEGLLSASAATSLFCAFVRRAQCNER